MRFHIYVFLLFILVECQKKKKNPPPTTQTQPTQAPQTPPPNKTPQTQPTQAPQTPPLNKTQETHELNQTSNELNKTSQNQINQNETIFNNTNENKETNNTKDNNLKPPKKTVSLKTKLKKFLRQDDDLDFYIIIGSFIFTLLMIIGFGILFYYIRKRRRIKYYKYNDEKVKDANNLSISTDSDPKKYEKVPN